MELGRVFFSQFFCTLPLPARILENNMDVGSESDALHVFGSLWWSHFQHPAEEKIIGGST